MLFSEVENCHNLGKIHWVCDHSLHQYVCLAAPRTVSCAWKNSMPQTVLGLHSEMAGQPDSSYDWHDSDPLWKSHTAGKLLVAGVP